MERSVVIVVTMRSILLTIVFTIVTLILFTTTIGVNAKVIRSRPAAEISFREMRFRTPPLVELYFDVVLRNDRPQPRWFLLPNNLGAKSGSDFAKGGVDGVEVFAPAGKGRVVFGHFLGTGGFHALLLPARAEVRLRLFPISFWGDLPDQVQVRVVIAKRVTIGEEKLEAWFGTDPLSSARADITEGALSQNRMVRSRHTPDHKELGTLIEEESRVELQIPLKLKT